MKNKFKLFSILVVLLGVVSSLTANHATHAVCNMHDGTVVTAWETLDGNDRTIIKASIGAVGTDPSLWSVTELTSGYSTEYFYSPTMYANDNGDVVVEWTYASALDKWGVMTAILPVGTTTWNVNIITDNDDNAGYFDEKVTIDESGNIFATWTSFNTVSEEFEVRCAAGTVGVSTTWDAPQVLSQ